MILEQWASGLTNPPLTLDALLEEHLANRAPKFSETVLQFVLPFMLVLAIRGEIVASFAVSYFSTRGEWH